MSSKGIKTSHRISKTICKHIPDKCGYPAHITSYSLYYYHISQQAEVEEQKVKVSLGSTTSLCHRKLNQQKQQIPIKRQPNRRNYGVSSLVECLPCKDKDLSLISRAYVYLKKKVQFYFRRCLN